MATAFVNSVQTKVGDGATEEVILRAIQKLNPRSIEIKKVVAAVKQEIVRGSRPTRRHKASTVIITTDGGPKTQSKPRSATPRKSRNSSTPKQMTLMEQLGEVLTANWTRAEREGFSPQKMNASKFVRAVHRNSDPRDATKARIVRACRLIDKRDIVITPTSVADLIREEF